MAYLSDYMDKVRKEANEQTTIKLAGSWLNFATMRQILNEMHLRGEEWPRISSQDDAVALGNFIRARADELRHRLPAATLDYRRPEAK